MNRKSLYVTVVIGRPFRGNLVQVFRAGIAAAGV